MKKPSVNLFANAKPSDPILTPATKPKKNAKLVVEMGSALDEIASIDSIKKFLDAKREMLESDVKTTMKSTFVHLALTNGSQPENYTGEGKISSASCEMKKRSSASVLSEAEIELLTKHNIPTKRDVSFSIPERFFFNEEIFAMGPKVLEKISAALAGIKELEGIDIIKHQPFQEVAKVVTDEASLPEVCKLTDPDVMNQLLDVVATFSLKPRLKGDVVIEDSYAAIGRIIGADKNKNTDTKEM